MGQSSSQLLLDSALRGDLEGVKRAVDAGGTIDGSAVTGDEHRSNALIVAAFLGHESTVSFLCGAFPTFIDWKNATGGTALLAAVLAGKLECVKILISHKADVNIRNNDESNALVIGAFAGHLEICEALLDSGGDADVRNKHGCNAILTACVLRRKNIIELLRERGYSAYEDKGK